LMIWLVTLAPAPSASVASSLSLQTLQRSRNSTTLAPLHQPQHTLASDTNQADYLQCLDGMTSVNLLEEWTPERNDTGHTHVRFKRAGVGSNGIQCKSAPKNAHRTTAWTHRHHHIDLQGSPAAVQLCYNCFDGCHQRLACPSSAVPSRNGEHAEAVHSSRGWEAWYGAERLEPVQSGQRGWKSADG
jgi:hypothetical protein